MGYESWLERDHLMAFDADPAVTAVASQPFWTHWRDGRRHAPDYFVRRRDGSTVVVDVRSDDRISAADADIFNRTEAACSAIGWSYRRTGALDPVLAANLRWLSGYRHPRVFRAGIAAELIAAFAAPLSLLEGARTVGDPIVVLPVVFHLLWHGRLDADLAASVMGERTFVAAVTR